MESFEAIAEYLPVEVRSPKGGGGHGSHGSSGHGSSGGSSGSGSKGSSGSSGSKGSSGSSGSSGSKGSSGSSGSKGSSGSGSKSSTVFVSTGGGSRYGSTYLPIWGWVIISVVSFIIFVFFVALIWSWVRESSRSRRESRPFRFGHVLWTAFKVATGLWFWIWLFKRFSGRDRSKYAKIEEGRNVGPTNGTWPGAAPAAAPYGAGGTGYVSQMTGKYEPMGYSGANITPSPITSPTPAPPPYVGGASQSYYDPKAAPRSPQPLSQVVYPPPAAPDSTQPAPGPFAAPAPHPAAGAPPVSTTAAPYTAPASAPPATGPPSFGATYVPSNEPEPAYY